MTNKYLNNRENGEEKHTREKKKNLDSTRYHQEATVRWFLFSTENEDDAAVVVLLLLFDTYDKRRRSPHTIIIAIHDIENLLMKRMNENGYF